MDKITLYLYDNNFSLLFQPDEDRGSDKIDELLDNITVFNPQYLARRKICNMKGWDMPRALIAKYYCCDSVKRATEKGEVEVKGIPYGLMSIVKRYILKKRIAPTTKNLMVDNKDMLKAINTKLTETYDLRDYQITAAEGLLTKPFGLCKAVTGSGKTRIMTAVVTAIAKPTIILMYSKSLVNQWHAQMKAFGLDPIRVYEGKVYPGKDTHIIIGTFQSICAPKMLKKSIYWLGRSDEDKSPIQALHPRLTPGLHPGRTEKIKKLLPGYPECIKGVIVDEAHTAPSITYYSVILKFSPVWCYGCTATPHREAGDELLMYAMFSDRIVPVPFEDVKGHLTVPSLIQIEVDKYLSDEKIEKEQEFLMGAEFVHLLCSDILRLMVIARVAMTCARAGKQFVITCGYMWLVEAVQKILEKQDIRSEVVAGDINQKEKDREAVKARLLARESDGVVTTTTYDVGVDVPTLEVMVYAYPFGSRTRIIQRAGRVARSADDKDTSTVVDIVDVKFDRTKALARKRAKVLKEEFNMNVSAKIPQQDIEVALPNML